MMQYSPRIIVLAMCLSALAGYIDALGFLHLNGIFVSFMSGNSTRFAVGIALKAGMRATMTGGIILLFVTGVFCGTLIGKFFDQGYGVIRCRGAAVLSFVTMLIFFASLFYILHQNALAISCMVLAMGAENAVFERDGEVSIGLTYMTGTLVKMGQRLAGIFWGGPKMAWAPYFFLWTGLVTGAVFGAFAYDRFNLGALWGAVTVAGFLTLMINKPDQISK